LFGFDTIKDLKDFSFFLHLSFDFHLHGNKRNIKITFVLSTIWVGKVVVLCEKKGFLSVE
jgi:hypothetical protein